MFWNVVYFWWYCCTYSNIGFISNIPWVYKTLGTPSEYWVAPPYAPRSASILWTWTLQGVESVPQGCWTMLTPMLPSVVSGWLDVLWVVDPSRYTQQAVERGKPSSVAVLGTLKPVRLALTTKLCSKALKSFVLPIYPLNGTHIQSMSQLSQGLTLLL
jgi:hypothetical protein